MKTPDKVVPVFGDDLTKTQASQADERDRVDRNEDGSLDDIVLCLEPDLMLRAEEMDDGVWWVAIHYTNKSGDDKSLVVNLYRRGTKRTRWEAVVENEGLVPDDDWAGEGHF